jgi:hypothetical protein
MEKPVQPAPARPAAKRAAPAKKLAGRQAAAPKTKAGTTAAPKPAKVKKPKLVRDSFTIPKDEYAVLDELKQRCVKLAQPSKKSELLRAGIKALAAMSDKALLATLQAVPAIKTGRPKKS